MEAGKKAGSTAIKIANSLVDLTVLVMILALVAVALYAIWDSAQIYRAADARQYAVYKPSSEESVSFSELQNINPEVFAWLTVSGTRIDYPVTQAEDNEKYVITDVYGSYSLSGSIFLDYLNDKQFQDFNSILYGHHMEKQAMFGPIEQFGNRKFFEERAYGSLYYGGKQHGLEFFAFVHTDAYDRSIFAPRIKGQEAQQAYLQNILDKAMYTRDIGVSVEDRIILLSTCSSDSTNGRDILIGRITDENKTDEYSDEEGGHAAKKVSVDPQKSVWRRIPFLFLIIPVFLILIKKRTKR